MYTNATLLQKYGKRPHKTHCIYSVHGCSAVRLYYLNKRRTIVIGLRQIGHPLFMAATVSAQVPQKRRRTHSSKSLH